MGLGVRTEYHEWKKHQHETGQTPMTPEEMWDMMNPDHLDKWDMKYPPVHANQPRSPGQDDDEVDYNVRTRSRGKTSTCEDQMPVKGKGKAKDKSKDKDLEIGPPCPRRPSRVPPDEQTPDIASEPQWHDDR